MNIDIKMLKKQLEYRLDLAAFSSESALKDLVSFSIASDEEIISMAKRYGISIEDYKIEEESKKR